MELIDGPSLADVLLRGPLPPAEVMDIVSQAAAALDAAHRAGLVHRDIKPANLLLTSRGRVKITDFGIAHAAGSAPVTRQGLLVGTPAYLAPERVAGYPATPASDLYSLGILAYECLAGTRPYAGTPVETALAHGQRALPPLPDSVPAPVARFVADLAAKDPGSRPANAGLAAVRAADLRADLTGHGAGRTAAGPAFAAGRSADVHPATLADMHAADFASSANGWDRGRYSARQWSRSRIAMALAATAVLAGLVGWVLSGVTGSLTAASSPPPTTAPPSSQSQSPSPSATVPASGLVGQRQGDVLRLLRGMGLVTQIQWVQPSSQFPDPGTVTNVLPTGPLAAGTVVTVSVVQKHDHGNGDGGGNGNGGGG
jgi:serine/threonine-protein kinase